jgi:hypothetical protein
MRKKAQHERETIIALFGSAPGQDLSSAKGTLWRAVNAVTYFAAHVRSGACRRQAGYCLVRCWLLIERKSLGEANRIRFLKLEQAVPTFDRIVGVSWLVVAKQSSLLAIQFGTQFFF